LLVSWLNSTNTTIPWVNNSATVIGWTNAAYLQSRLEATITIPLDKRTITIPGGTALPGFLYFDPKDPVDQATFNFNWGFLYFDPKDPVDQATFNFNWGAWINGSDPVLTVNSVSASPSGLTIGTPSLNNNVVSVVLTGGTAGINYTVSCQVTTVGGTVAKRSGILPVQTR